MRALLPLRLALPHIEPFLADNVEKEVRKDALVIRCAAEAFARGTRPDAGAVHRLLADARAIDREFLAGIGGLPVRIEIPYGRIEPLRLRRIERGLELCRRVLEAWRQGRRLREVTLRAELERDLREILTLYCEETAALSHGVRLPALLVPLRERLTGALLQIMREIAADIASQKRR